MDKKNKLIGKVFGRLTCINNLGRKGHNYLIECKCECGKITKVLDTNLKKGRTQSCGCWGQSKGSDNKNWRGFGNISQSYYRQLQKGAIDRNLEFSVSIEHIWDLFLMQNRRCALTGIELFFRESHKDKRLQTASLDRIDSDIPYINGNVQWIHKDLNFMKQDFPEEYFVRMCELVSKNYKKLPQRESTLLSEDYLRRRFLDLNDFFMDV